MKSNPPEPNGSAGAPSASDPAGPLAGVRVLDLTHVMAGAWCGCLLAQMGADVIKVERPTPGEELRMGQARTGGAFRPFDAVNHGKRSISIDLDRPEGVEIVRQLALSADVLVENYRPGSLEARGLGYDALAAEHPALIYASITAFGRTGPYRDRPGFDLIAQAAAGLMSLTGEKDAAPMSAGVPVADLGAGTLAALGVLSAWIHRLRTGQGQLVDTSLFEAALSTTLWESALFLDTGRVARANGARHRLASPYGCFPTADGWIAIAAGTQRTYRQLLEVIGDEALANAPEFATPVERLRHRDDLEARLRALLARRTSAEWLAELEAAGVPCGPVNDMESVWQDPQTLARDMLAEGATAPEAGDAARPLRVVGPAVKLSASPWQASGSAPVLGEDSRAVLAEAGWSAEEIEGWIAEGIVEAPPRDPGEEIGAGRAAPAPLRAAVGSASGGRSGSGE
ncbi:MAG: CoA transferase [Myxococcota bacterium]